MVRVCVQCGNIQMATDQSGKPVCPICLGDTFKAVELPDILRCVYCKVEKVTSEILKIWNTPPFYNAKDGTYYCGCRGFE